MCAYVRVSLTPLFLLPTVKDYLDLLCRMAYVPSWLTCLNCLCMANSKDVQSHRVTHSGHTPLPFYPVRLQIACQKWRARMYLHAPLVELNAAVGFECSEESGHDCLFQIHAPLIADIIRQRGQ